ncbi:MAG: P8 [Corattcep virus 2]|nr:MAG: P8 [Corattcep virus 2]
MFQYVKVEQIPNVKIFVYINDHHKLEMRKYLRQYYGINVSEGNFFEEIKLLLTIGGKGEENEYAEIEETVFQKDTYEEYLPKINKIGLDEEEKDSNPFDLLCEPIYDRKTSINDVRWKANQMQDYDAKFYLEKDVVHIIKRVPSDENVDNTFRIHARSLKPLGAWEVVRDDQKREVIYSASLSPDKIKPEMDGIAKIDVTLWNDHVNRMLYLMTKDHVFAHLDVVFKYILKHKKSNSFIHVFPMLSKSKIGDFYFDTTPNGNMVEIIIDGIKSAESQCDNFVWMLGQGWNYLSHERFEDLDYRIWFKNVSISIIEWIRRDVGVQKVIKNVYHLSHTDYGIKCFRIEW